MPIRAGDEQAVAGGDDALGDGGDLFWGLAQAENDFRHSLPQRAMVIDAREAEIFERRLA